MGAPAPAGETSEDTATNAQSNAQSNAQADVEADATIRAAAFDEIDRALALIPIDASGHVVIREAACPDCCDDGFHIDAWAAWDDVWQDHVFFERTSGRAVCPGCGEDIKETARTVELAEILPALGDQLALEAQHFCATARDPATAGRSETPKCRTCGAEDGLRFDAFAEICPQTGSISIASVMDKGHECDRCGGSARIDFVQPTAHRSASILRRRALRAKALRVAADILRTHSPEEILSLGWAARSGDAKDPQ